MASRVGFMSLALLLAAGLFLSMQAEARGDSADMPQIKVKTTYLEFKHGPFEFTRYVIDDKAAKPYFFPVYALPGKAVTRAWPMEKDPEIKKMDHPHQKSIWFCHGDVVPEGLEFKKHMKNVVGIDFWSEGKGHGKIVCVKVETPTQAKDHASVVTRNEWRTAEGQKVMEETRTITYYPFAAGANLLVMDIDLHATDYPITFADTKEGALGVRIRESINGNHKGLLTNAEGKTGEGKRPNKDKKGTWGLVSAWCDYSGPISEKQSVGVTLFASPKNPIDTAWHVGNYGLMAANPFGREKHAGFPDRAGNNTPVKLAKGEHLKLRYGIFVHDGDVKSGKVAEYYERFTKLARK